MATKLTDYLFYRRNDDTVHHYATNPCLLNEVYEVTAYMLWNGSAIRIENTNLDGSGLGSYPAIFEAFTTDLDKKGIPLEVFDMWLQEKGRVVISIPSLDDALEDCIQSFVENLDVNEKVNMYKGLVAQLYENGMNDLFDWVTFDKRRMKEITQDGKYYAVKHEGQWYFFEKDDTEVETNAS